MILIRVEDREQFGQGNRSRAIAIAQSLHRLGEKYCIIASSSKWHEYLKLNNFSTVLIENNYDISLEVNIIKDSFTDSKIYFIILDGDRFGSKYINLLKVNQIKSVIIDDVAKIKRTEAWTLINPNIYASIDLYNGWKIPLHVGPDYLLLREQFLVRTNIQPIKNKILLALGIMMNQESTYEINERFIKEGYITKIAKGLSPEQMVKEIDSSVLVICGASVTLHEVWYRKRLALPVYQAKDQELFYEFLQKNDLPHVISINRNKKDVIEEILIKSQKVISSNETQKFIKKGKIDNLLINLINYAN
ncbi:hypothetical protein MCN98_07905 [Flavobacteriaceae bacterium LSUCC0859]|nr:hypothetical protein [Flavobacteriaceae bacterium LSUCC0859]